MAYEDRHTKQAAVPAAAGPAHGISMENRERLSISGVTEVESFDEQTVVLETVGGRLVVDGEGLNIRKLSTDQGDVSILGRIHGLHYEESAPRQSLWARMFR